MPRVKLQRVSSAVLYAALAGSLAAVAREVQPLPLVIFGLAFGAGLFLDLKGAPRRALHPVLVPGLSAAVILAFLGTSGGSYFTRALGVLLIIVSAKLVSPKGPRDLLQLYLLNLLLVAAAAVSRWGLEFGLLVLLEAFMSITGLVFIHGSGEQREVGRAEALCLLRLSGLITAGLVPATVFLFLVIPRPTGTFFAWGGGAEARTGFSDRVSPGTVEEIKVDPSPAFRVRWLGGRPPVRPLWRGVVYDTYVTGIWEKRYKGVIDPPVLSSKRVRYEILLEPTDLEYLLSFGLPVSARLKGREAYLSPGYTLEAGSAIETRTLYGVEAYDLQDFPAEIPPGSYLEVPEDIRVRLRPLADRLSRKRAIDTAGAVVSHLKGSFGYSLTPGEARGDPVLYFLFQRREGHCEYFASAMVLLLRTQGIPARIVGGYLGGEWNEMGRYFLVRRSDAHTWVEVWVEGRGWVSFDPTPGTPQPRESILGRRILGLVDFLRLKWYYWVLDYDLGRQLDLARKVRDLFRSMGSKGLRPGISLQGRDLLKLLPVALIVLMAFVLRTALSRYRKRPGTRGERFVYVMSKRGHKKRRGETLREFAHRIGEKDAPMGEKAVSFVENYYPFEYGRMEGREKFLDRLLKDMGKGSGRGDRYPLDEGHSCPPEGKPEG